VGAACDLQPYSVPRFEVVLRRTQLDSQVRCPVGFVFRESRTDSDRTQAAVRALELGALGRCTQE
jgi:hypothetical protein